jgi:prepilin-type N-terminal cleavage/methylation domain-containing protein
MSPRKRRPGFSLIELLISSSLILFLIAGTAQLLGLSLTAKRNADFHFRAARLASSRLEHLKSLPHDSADLEAGNHEEDFNDPSSPERYRIAWRVEDMDQNLKKVVLDFFSPNKPRRKAVFCLLLCRELEF